MCKYKRGGGIESGFLIEFTRPTARELQEQNDTNRFSTSQ